MSEINDQALETAAAESGINPGVRLAEARELLKLSTADIARDLKLSVSQVEALEAGHFDRLPGAVFVRGFIRNYARLVKLNPDELLRAAGSSLPQQVPRPETPPSQDIPFPSARLGWWQKYVWMAAVVIAALAFYEYFVSEEETVVTTHPVEVAPVPPPVALPTVETAPAPPMSLPEEANKTAAAEAAPSEAFKMPTPVAVSPESDKTSTPGVAPPEADQARATPAMDRADETARKETPAPVPVEASPSRESVAVAEPPNGAESASPSPAVVPAQDSEAAPKKTRPGERQVTLVFEDESWVEIRDRDGKLILWQLNPPGTRQVVSGSPPLSFVIGNAHGVQLTYDDRQVDLGPYTRTDVARMTLE